MTHVLPNLSLVANDIGYTIRCYAKRNIYILYMKEINMYFTNEEKLQILLY